MDNVVGLIIYVLHLDNVKIIKIVIVKIVKNSI